MKIFKNFVAGLITGAIIMFAIPALAQFNVPQGGTGLITAPAGWFITGSSALRLTAQQFVDLASDISGTLPVGNGGTGAATFVNNRLLTGNGTSALVDEANLTFDGSLLTVTGQLTATATSTFATTTVLGNLLQYKTFVTMGTSDANYITDGVADQVQCNAALAYLKSVGGGRLIIKNGTYNFSAFCGVQGSSNITVEGESRGAIIVVGFTDAAAEGALSFYNATNATPTSNITVKNLTINMGSFRTPGVLFQGVSSTASATSTHFLIDNVEFVGRIGDATGSRGQVLIKGSYTGIAGSLDDVRITRSTFRDNVTGGVGTVSVAIHVLSDNLTNFSVDHSEFKNLYGGSIGYISGDATRQRNNFTFDHNRFYHTKLYGSELGATGDIYDSGQTGVKGLVITNNYFEDDPTNISTTTVQPFNILTYNTSGTIIDNNEFYNSRVVFSQGDTNKGNFGTSFTKNKLINIGGLLDGDSDYASIYDGNTFINTLRCPIFFGYGYHFPSRYTNNIFYNVCVTANVAHAYNQAPFLMEEGGNVIEGNTFYATSSTSTMGYIFTELYDPGSDINNEDPNVYRNNTIFGEGVGTTTFYTNSAYKHVIQNNSGITELKIQNHYANLTESSTGTDLLSTDVVSGNSTLAGLPTQNTTLFGGNVGIGTTTPKYLLTVASSTAPQLSLSAGAGLAQWAFRNAGGNLYLSTTTVAGTATTSTSALSIAGDGFGTTTLRGLSIVGQATSTSNIGYDISDGCYAVDGICIGATGPQGPNGSGAGTFSTTTCLTVLCNYPNNTSDILVIGSNSTTTGEFWFDPNMPLAYIGSSIGIGTTSPFGKFSVEQGTETASLWIGNQGSTSPSLVVNGVNGNGRVGIGTAAPTAVLESSTVSAGARTTNLRLRNTGAGANTAASIGWEFGATGNTDAAFISAPFISTGAGLIFATGGNTSNGTEKVRILEGGNVGIGTTTPYALLQIATSSAGTTFKSQLVLSDTAAGTDLKHWGIRSVLGSLQIGNSTDAYATSTDFTILTGGNVGIGTTTPGTLLSVQGVANFGTATSTFSSTGGVNLTAGCFSIASVCIGATGLPGSSAIATTTSTVSGQLVAYPNNTSDILAVGSNSTTTAEYFFDPNAAWSKFTGRMDRNGETRLDGIPDSDHSAVGDTTNTFNAGETIAEVFSVYMGSDGKWYKTDADVAASSTSMLGIHLYNGSSVSADAPLLVALPGSFVRDDSFNWTPGATIYLSTSAGAWTDTAPSGTDDVIRVVGHAVTADVVLFNPSPDYFTAI